MDFNIEIIILLPNQMSSKHQPGFLPWDRTGNPILVHSSLGKSKPTHYDIPE